MQTQILNGSQEYIAIPRQAELTNADQRRLYSFIGVLFLDCITIACIVWLLFR